MAVTTLVFARIFARHECMNRIIVITLLGVALALGWWALDSRSRSLQREAELAALRRAHDEAAAAAEKARSELSPLQENVARLKKERDEALGNRSATVPTDGGKASSPAIPVMPEVDALNTPGVRQSVASATRLAIADQYRKDYAQLLKKWNLAPAELDHVVSLLPSLEMGPIDFMMSRPEARNLGPAELDAGAAKLGQETRQKLEAILGPERIAELDAFKTDVKINTVVGPYAERLDITGSPLTREQKIKLAEALSVPTPRIKTDGSAPIPADVLRKRSETRNEKIIQAATGFLSPDQVNGLQAVFREEIEKEEAAGKLIEEMLKDGK
jgi:hypothetical protein